MIRCDKMDRLYLIILRLIIVLSVSFNLFVLHKASGAMPDDINQSNNRSVAQASRLPQILDFTQFKRVFNKHYASYTEELRRQKLFVARYLNVFASRMKYYLRLITSHFGINNLSDRTREERQRLSMKSKHIAEQLDYDPTEVRALLNNKRRISLPDMLNKLKNFMAEREDEKPSNVKVIYGYDIGKKAELPIVLKSSELPPIEFDIDRTKEGPHYNLIESGCFNPPGDQGDCGSCYVFTAMAIAEYLFCRSFGRSIKFSEQFVLDCGKPFDLDGCDGGTFTKISNFIHILGLDVNQWYPYQAKEGICKFSETNSPTKIINSESAGYIRMKSKPNRLLGAEQDWESFLQLGIPLDVTVAVDIDKFADYAGGVDLGDVISDDLHSMTLVGSGIERGVEYWLLRNSFGLGWGENGHYKLQRKAKAIAEEGLGETFEAFLDKDLSGLFEFNSNYKHFEKSNQS